MKTVFAYYQSILNSNQEEQFLRANYWKHSWEKAGWRTGMLNRSHAQASPYMSKILRKIAATLSGSSLQHGPSKDILTARIIRWVALHAAKGGWLSHYDVVNTGFTPDAAEEIEKNAQIQMSCPKAYLVYVSQPVAAQAIEIILSEPIVNGDLPIEEPDILGITTGLESLNLPIIHVQETDLTKSENMKNICESLEK